ncbi:MAG: hypothetical protein HYZ54_13940 [Ignavibacteriae bacterium]|nr:hypothetical protein [Ignavibacteriota bacterium]
MAKSTSIYGDQWSSFFGNLSNQGDSFNGLISKSNQYYAFLSKVDQVDSSNYDLYFELMTKEWGDNVMFAGSVQVSKMPPEIPTASYSMVGQDGSKILSTLGLKSFDDLAEGSWYLIQLEKGETGPLIGNLYNPDIDLSL